MLRTKVLRFLRRILGTQQILDHLGAGPVPADSGARVRTTDGRELTLLPGTQYARYAVPIEYAPSRDFRARYGSSHPPIKVLEDWFAAHAADYAEFVRYMRSLDVSRFAKSTEVASASKPAWIGGPISAFDSLALYAMVRKYSPRRYLEIGSGMTTCFARQAVNDGGLQTRIISIDPEPRSEVDSICDEVIRYGLETYNLDVFDDLEPSDIVFFDGSHRSFMNSDVTVFFIDVLPRLKPGVIVHVHDINLPWDYPEWAREWYWNEQYMLAVYMMGNRNRIRPLFPTAFVCRSPLFEEDLRLPFVDLGSNNDSWRGGGSMWFTHDRSAFSV